MKKPAAPNWETDQRMGRMAHPTVLRACAAPDRTASGETGQVVRGRVKEVAVAALDGGEQGGRVGRQLVEGLAELVEPALLPRGHEQSLLGDTTSEPLEGRT